MARHHFFVRSVGLGVLAVSAIVAALPMGAVAGDAPAAIPGAAAEDQVPPGAALGESPRWPLASDAGGVGEGVDAASVGVTLVGGDAPLVGSDEPLAGARSMSSALSIPASVGPMPAIAPPEVAGDVSVVAEVLRLGGIALVAMGLLVLATTLRPPVARRVRVAVARLGVRWSGWGRIGSRSLVWR